MALWKVSIFIRPSGKCPVADYLASSQVSPRDRRGIDTRIRMIQNVEQLHGDWVVNYKTTMLQRLKPNCQHRFLCVKNESEKRIILLNGMLKKRKHLPDKKIVEADAMFAEFGKGHGSVEDYQFD